MATRAYLPSTGAAPISPAFSAWSITTGADYLLAVRTRISSAMTDKTTGGANTAGTTVLSRVYLLGPLAAQTIPISTIKGTIRALESATNDNLDAMRLAVRVVSGDGSTYRSPVLYGPANSTVAELATSLRAKRLATGGATASVVTSQGDYLVIEIGFTNTGTGASVSGTVNYGDNSATDLGDNETDTTALNPFVELAADLAYLYSDSLTEAASAADSPSANAISNVAVTEAASAADAPSASATLQVSLSETASASDTTDAIVETPRDFFAPAAWGGMSWGGFLAVDEPTAGEVTADLTEAATAADAPGATVTHAASLTEAASAADATDAGVTQPASLDEAASADDATDAGVSQPATVSEAASAADELDADIEVQVAADLEEPASATDTTSAVTLAAASLDEAASAADDVSSSLITPASLDEAASADDLVDAVAGAGATMEEPANADDTTSATLTAAVSLDEAASATDLVEALVLHSASVTEAGNAQDLVAAATIISVTVIETANADDETNGLVGTSADLSEGGNATDTTNAAVLRFITGRVRLSSTTGAVVPGTTLRLFLTATNVLSQTTVAAGDGSYSFTVPDDGAQYYIVAYKVGTPDRFGTTLNTLEGGDVNDVILWTEPPPPAPPVVVNGGGGSIEVPGGADFDPLLDFLREERRTRVKQKKRAGFDEDEDERELLAVLKCFLDVTQ